MTCSTFQARHIRLDLGETPLLMGIVNVTPDSFFDGGRYLKPEVAVAHAIRLVEEGADIVDIGAESTRPGATPVDEAEELRRLIPVVSSVAKTVRVPLSVDTSKAGVARAAIDAGAVIINDVTALRGDPAMAELAADTGAGVILMHMKGTPSTMQQAPRYEDVVDEISTFFSERLRFSMERGIARSRVILDPGIGFGKLLHDNLDILAHLHAFAQFDCPVLVGLSRKAFIGQITGRPVDDRLWGSAAAVALAVWQGAQIIRVHDVGPMRDVVNVAAAVTKRNLSFMRDHHA